MVYAMRYAIIHTNCNHKWYIRNVWMILDSKNRGMVPMLDTRHLESILNGVYSYTPSHRRKVHVPEHKHECFHPSLGPDTFRRALTFDAQ